MHPWGQKLYPQHSQSLRPFRGSGSHHGEPSLPWSWPPGMVGSCETGWGPAHCLVTKAGLKGKMWHQLFAFPPAVIGLSSPQVRRTVLPPGGCWLTQHLGRCWMGADPGPSGEGTVTCIPSCGSPNLHPWERSEQFIETHTPPALQDALSQQVWGEMCFWQGVCLIRFTPTVCVKKAKVRHPVLNVLFYFPALLSQSRPSRGDQRSHDPSYFQAISSTCMIITQCSKAFSEGSLKNTKDMIPGGN